MQSVADISAAVTAGRSAPVTLLAEAQARHRETHARLNALVQERFAAAAREAEAATGPLAGVPVSVKECFAVAGLRTTLGIGARREA
ncbi:MAG: amidase family protein, partial [bacterium]